MLKGVLLSSLLSLLLLSLLFYYCYYYYLRLIQLRPCITHAYQAKELQKKCCYLSLASNLPQFVLMAHGRLAKQKTMKKFLLVVCQSYGRHSLVLYLYLSKLCRTFSFVSTKQTTSLWFLIGRDYNLVILLVFSLFLRCLDLCSTHEWTASLCRCSIIEWSNLHLWGLWWRKRVTVMWSVRHKTQQVATPSSNEELPDETFCRGACR